MATINDLADLALELDNNSAFRLADKITLALNKFANEEPDHELGMVRNEMETAKRAIEGIEDVVGEDGEGNLMAWVQSKISNAVQMLKGVSDYLVSEETVGQKTAAKNEGKTLNKPFRTPGGPKKFSVYVKNDKGNIIKVNFGSPEMRIKDNIPGRRKNFRARHRCDSDPRAKDKTTPKFWSCKQWSDSKSDI
jgi:hypothetical protein